MSNPQERLQLLPSVEMLLYTQPKKGTAKRQSTQKREEQSGTSITGSRLKKVDGATAMSNTETRCGRITHSQARIGKIEIPSRSNRKVKNTAPQPKKVTDSNIVTHSKREPISLTFQPWNLKHPKALLLALTTKRVSC